MDGRPSPSFPPSLSSSSFVERMKNVAYLEGRPSCRAAGIFQFRPLYLFLFFFFFSLNFGHDSGTASRKNRSASNLGDQPRALVPHLPFSPLLPSFSLSRRPTNDRKRVKVHGPKTRHLFFPFLFPLFFLLRAAEQVVEGKNVAKKNKQDLIFPPLSSAPFPPLLPSPFFFPFHRRKVRMAR